MCTILIKLFRHIPAIPACPLTTYHSLKALDIASVVNSVSGPAAMYKLSQSYSCIMPSWIRDCLFNPELERHRLSSHQYCQHDSVRTMRQMQDVHLVDFVELSLRSKDVFDAAFDIMLSTNLLEYLKHFLLPQLVTGLHNSTPDKSSMKLYKNTTNILKHPLHHNLNHSPLQQQLTQTTATLCPITLDLKKRMQLSTLISLLSFL